MAADLVRRLGISFRHFFQPDPFSVHLVPTMAKKQADAEVWAVVADKEDDIRMDAFKVINVNMGMLKIVQKTLAILETTQRWAIDSLF